MPATVDDTGIQLHFLQKDWTNFLRFCLVLQNTQHYKIINSNIAVQLRTMYLPGKFLFVTFFLKLLFWGCMT